MAVDGLRQSGLSLKTMTGKTTNLSDAAEYLGFSRRTFYNMIEDGRFPVLPIPGTKPRKWNIDDLDAWLKGVYVAPGERV